MAVERLEEQAAGRPTTLWIGPGALRAAGEELAAWVAGRSLFVVSSPQVLALHGERLAPLMAAARQAVTLAVPDGESAKTVAEAGRLWETMLAGGGKRDSRVVAFGGGSVGDLAGFAAGCFLRGIAFAQLPTTLLAQVDASVGGKTGVDLPAAKNSVGLFHFPDHVVADTEVLATLPDAELRAGLAEVIKMALLLDGELFAHLERHLPELLAGDAAALAPVVRASIAAKLAVVARDPTEQGERRLLNFGHTLGHALEAVAGYAGLRHGEAVAYGMLFALRLARRRGLAQEVSERLAALLERLALPPLPALEPGALLAAMGRDKKAREGGIAWVLPTALGAGTVVPDVPMAEVAAELPGFLAVPWDPSPIMARSRRELSE